MKILSVCDSIDSQGRGFKALVYELMANGSLEDWLHRSSGRESRGLSLIQRLNIAIDVASAVEYLHYGTESTVVHGDLKPSNVLLDEDMVAHVGDYGLAKIISRNASSLNGTTSDIIKGTIGYIAPGQFSSLLVYAISFQMLAPKVLFKKISRVIVFVAKKINMSNVD